MESVVELIMTDSTFWPAYTGLQIEDGRPKEAVRPSRTASTATRGDNLYAPPRKDYSILPAPTELPTFMRVRSRTNKPNSPSYDTLFKSLSVGRVSECAVLHRNEENTRRHLRVSTIKF